MKLVVVLTSPLSLHFPFTFPSPSPLLFPLPFPPPPPQTHFPSSTMDRNQSETKGLTREKHRKEPAVVEEAEDDDEEMEEDRKRRSVVSAARRGSGAGGGGGGASQPCCQAEKCGADLTVAKRYHRRHKVCEAHSKASSALVAGLRQRFCQQCSRFHELSEFDEAKRSCRRRLAGHNERRRKSSSESQGESSSCCGQVDQGGGGTLQISSLPGSPHFQIR